MGAIEPRGVKQRYPDIINRNEAYIVNYVSTTRLTNMKN